ncbi:hypothetical protein ACWKSP_26410 [Micromonosporaceae bacterium Da 78-11]
MGISPVSDHRARTGSYRELVINPGERALEYPDDETAREQAELNLQAFVDEFTELGGELVDEPERDQASDEGGRYAWLLPMPGDVRVQVLMPGVALAELKTTSAEAPCLRVDGAWWWWAGAVGAAVPLDVTHRRAGIRP